MLLKERKIEFHRMYWNSIKQVLSFLPMENTSIPWPTSVMDIQCGLLPAGNAPERILFFLALNRFFLIERQFLENCLP